MDLISRKNTKRQGLFTGNLFKWDFLEHSNYIMEYSKKFEILSSEPRKPLSEHDIIEF